MEDTERQRGEEMEATEKQVINFHLDRNADGCSKSDLYAHTSSICQSCRSLGTDFVCVHVVLTVNVFICLYTSLNREFK